MTALHYLFAWANAPYTVAAGIAVLFVLLQASGLLGLLAGDGDDHDVDADADADADHDVDHDHLLLAPLGIGKIPFSIVWQTYALVFAITGFLLNLAAIHADGTVPLLTLAWTFPISLVTGYGAVATLARLLGPVLSSKDQEATTRKELVGQVGVVISSRISPEFGEVRVKDKSGHELRVICRLADGEHEPREREQVVFVECDDDGKLLVSPLDR